MIPVEKELGQLRHVAAVLELRRRHLACLPEHTILVEKKYMPSWLLVSFLEDIVFF